MYLLSYYEDKGLFEASLGGKVTLSELDVFREELSEIVECRDGLPFNLLLDYSRVKGFYLDVMLALCDIRDRCHELGAQKIVNVAPSESHIEEEVAHRLNQVMQGAEDFVLDPSYARFPSVPREALVAKVA